MGQNRWYPWQRKQSMQLDTGRRSVVVLWQLTQVFRFLLAPGTSCHTPPRAALTAVLARKVKSLLSHLNQQGFGRIPLDFEVNFLPSEELIRTFPSTLLRHPSNPVRQDF
eukprot:2745855-Amphidinium_carterae.2